MLCNQIGEQFKSLTWEGFKGVFLEHFCLKSAIERIEEEFIVLRQTTESIDEMAGKFYDNA